MLQNKYKTKNHRNLAPKQNKIEVTLKNENCPTSLTSSQMDGYLISITSPSQRMTTHLKCRHKQNYINTSTLYRENKILLSKHTIFIKAPLGLLKKLHKRNPRITYIKYKLQYFAIYRHTILRVLLAFCTSLKAYSFHYLDNNIIYVHEQHKNQHN